MLDDLLRDLAFETIEGSAVQSVADEIIADVADALAIDVVEVTMVEEQEGARLRREREDASAMGGAVTEVIERAILQHLLSTITTKGEGVSFSADVLMPLLSNFLFENLLALAIDIGGGKEAVTENAVAKAMVHEAAHQKVLQGFLRQLYAQHTLPSFGAPAQQRDVLAEKEEETKDLSFARMVDERNRLAREVLSIAHAPLDSINAASNLKGARWAEYEIERADKEVEEARKKRQDEMKQRQARLQEKMKLLRQRSGHLNLTADTSKIQRLVLEMKQRRTAAQVKQDILTESFLDGSKVEAGEKQLE